MPWHFDVSDHISLIVQGTLSEITADGSFWAAPGSLVHKPSTVQHHTRIGPQGAVVLSIPRPRSEVDVYGWSSNLKTSRLLGSLLMGKAVSDTVAEVPRPACGRKHPLVSLADRLLRRDPSVSLSDLAAQVGANTSYLSHLFGETLGQTFCERRTLHRLTVATNAIADGATLGEASGLAHFSDQAHFIRAFRFHFLISPREYQRALRSIS